MNPLTRRNILSLSAMISASGLAECAGPSPNAPPVPAAASAIDVHCHVFNARDIPVHKFIKDVVLREYPFIQSVTDPIIELAQAIMGLGAISAEAEAEQLMGNVGNVQRMEQLPQLPSFDGDDNALVRDRVKRAVERLQGMPANSSLEAPPASRMTPELRGYLLNLIQKTAYVPHTDLTVPPNSKLSQQPAVPPAAAGRAASLVGGEITGILRLASLLTLSRRQLTERLRALPRVDGGEVAFFTPAMVDYGYWLGAEHETTPLQQQVDVMSALAAVKNRPYAVHAYVSFCPWRQLLEPEQMETVQEAVLRRGCIGVKVYPVMGFLPYGNDGANAADYPERLTSLGPHWGRDLDAALASLYDFCVANDVPILAHCSQSQDTSDQAGRRASPEAWRSVFIHEQWRKLRLDLGHFGGFWDLAKADSNGWAADAVNLMVNYPNVYADVADHDTVVVRTDAQKHNEEMIVGNLARIFAVGDPRSIARHKLMYGTDWVMLSRADGTDDYYESMKTRFPSDLRLNAAEIRGFLGGNAARFLGLVPSSPTAARPKTRQRLETFYKLHGLDNAMLAKWDLARSNST